jgi:hypothetical protein
VHRKLMVMLMLTSGAALLLAAVMSIVNTYFQVREDLAVNLGVSATLVLENTRGAVSFADPLERLPISARSDRTPASGSRASIWPAAGCLPNSDRSRSASVPNRRRRSATASPARAWNW